MCIRDRISAVKGFYAALAVFCAAVSNGQELGEILSGSFREILSGVFCPGGLCPGGFRPEGFCPGGFCPGNYVLDSWSTPAVFPKFLAFRYQHPGLQPSCHTSTQLQVFAMEIAAGIR